MNWQLFLFCGVLPAKITYFLKSKEILDSGVIGTPTGISLTLHKSPKPNDNDPNTNWRINPEISGGGYFHDLASHLFDLLDFLFGDITSANGTTDSTIIDNPAQDRVIAKFTFASGLSGTGNWDFTVSENQRRDNVVIEGTAGRMSFATFNGEAPIVVETQSEKKEYHLPYPAHVQQPLIQSIVDELRGVGTCPSTGQTAARANWVMGEVLKIN